MTGKVISLGQVIVDLTMNVDAVPRAGEDVFAGNVQTQVGASFNTLYAVRRMGVKASHAGVIGTGPVGFADSANVGKSGNSAYRQAGCRARFGILRGVDRREC